MNNTRVLPARIFATKQTGGRAEVMLERRLADGRWRAFVKSSKTPKPGAILNVAEDLQIELLDRDGDLFVLRLLGEDPMKALHEHGHMPLPPYIKREDNEDDRERYQTVFAKQEGAVARPPACTLRPSCNNSGRGANRRGHVHVGQALYPCAVMI